MRVLAVAAILCVLLSGCVTDYQAQRKSLFKQYYDDKSITREEYERKKDEIDQKERSEKASRAVGVLCSGCGRSYKMSQLDLENGGDSICPYCEYRQNIQMGKNAYDYDQQQINRANTQRAMANFLATTVDALASSSQPTQTTYTYPNLNNAACTQPAMQPMPNIKPPSSPRTYGGAYTYTNYQGKSIRVEQTSPNVATVYNDRGAIGTIERTSTTEDTMREMDRGIEETKKRCMPYGYK